MAGGSYTIKLYTDAGVELETLTTYLSLEYSIVAGDVGVCALVMPHTWTPTNALDGAEVALDHKIAISRTAPGGGEVLENVYLLRAVELFSTERGDFTKLIGMDGNQLLSRRYVDTPSTTVDTWSNKTGPADDVMKELVREALTDDADNWSRWIPFEVGGTTYFAVAADASLGPTITDDFAYENLLSSIKKIVATAIQAGHPVYWRVVPTTAVQYTFTTYHDVIGTNRTATVTLSQANNNMRNPKWSYDAAQEVNGMRVNGGNYGAANKDLRHGVIAEDEARMQLSVYNRCEDTVEAYGTDDSAAKLGERGKGAMRERNPKRSFMCEIAENASFRYGLHYFFGDLLTWSYRGQSGTALVKSIVIKYGPQGETVDAGLDIYLANNPA